MESVIDSDELRNAIALNVARLRAEKELSQDELAKKVGVSRAQINRLEKGRHSPSAELLFTLADCLGVQADSLRQISSHAHA